MCNLVEEVLFHRDGGGGGGDYGATVSGLWLL